MTTLSNPNAVLPGNGVQGIVANIVVLKSLVFDAGRTGVCLVKEKREWFGNGEVGICDVLLRNCRGGLGKERNCDSDRKERSCILCFLLCEDAEALVTGIRSRNGGRGRGRN